jgi:predicted 3-demethylubiquinone-9 3-methyltransferase (glyoxalase superfamily)
MEKLGICLWFDGNAEEAVKYYTSIFKDSKTGNTTKYTEAVSEAAKQPAGSVMTIDFQINGMDFLALNGGPYFKFNEAVSIMVNCKDQKEIDYYWEKLSAGGEEQPCGWVKDKFGLSWQIIPQDWDKMMTSGDQKKSDAAMKEMLTMKKLDIKKLEDAYNNA